ncbi:MarR family winged helix-turn-helix transcriptional regulator [Phosphitispora sp. TUW77]|uniref:MarR family winged helix-turn-helix transcriptional regulator n=1 Tax=Phosphitispora sp. TUW77 TaxID=3152361 RepID=UPI003AB7E846
MDVSEFKHLLWDNTRKIYEGMNTILNEWGGRYGLSALQLRILMEVYQKGTHTVGSLASNILVAGANISAMCKKLENLGFLIRTRNPFDERVVLIELTDMGKETMQEIDKLFEEKMYKLLEKDAELKESLETVYLAMVKLNALLYQLDDNVNQKQE